MMSSEDDVSVTTTPSDCDECLVVGVGAVEASMMSSEIDVSVTTTPSLDEDDDDIVIATDDDTGVGKGAMLTITNQIILHIATKY